MTAKTSNGKSKNNRRRKIGLALSGGGFRASIFHLGVIRRLEELGIMKDVSVLSTVSGGSIIGAYYVCEMEERLRKRRAELAQQLDDVRLEIFEEIAEAFFDALDHNLRSRALIFSLFYHPILFLKSLRPGYTRSDIMQKEYDTFFFDGKPLDQLPSVTQRSEEPCPTYLIGPKLMINTTSLLNGERKAFSRDPISGINELRKVNRNILPLSRIVGASAGVPGLFPPTWVSGDLLVDGGVSDNQGIDGLLKEGSETGGKNDYDLLIVSDASGQLEQLDRIKPKLTTVLGRTMSIFQHEIRNKELGRLLAWKRGEEATSAQGRSNNAREFAFVHLFLNVKDRCEDVPRVASEYIPAIARIRTDLDQFSFVERETLMYHGYTLVDAQLKKHCRRFLEERARGVSGFAGMRTPPLFLERYQQGSTGENQADKRELIKAELEAGQQSVFLLRSLTKYRFKAVAVVAFTWLVPIYVFFRWLYAQIDQWAERFVQRMADAWLGDALPGWLRAVFGASEGLFRWPITAKGTTILVVFVLVAYFLAFLTYVIMRRRVLKWDRKAYHNLAREAPSTHWKVKPTSGPVSTGGVQEDAGRKSPPD